MRSKALLTTLSLALTANLADAAAPPPAFWMNAAASEIVVVATINVPTEQLDLSAGALPPLVEVEVSIETVLKGDVSSDNIIVNQVTGEDFRSVPNSVLAALDDKRVVLFLVDAHGRGARGYFFSGSEGAHSATTPFVADLEAEIVRQNTVVKDWQPHLDAPLRAEVAAIIEQMLNPQTQRDAIEKLDALDPDAFIAIVDLMDDRRPLPFQEASFANDFPVAFEGTRHYAPELVVDVFGGLLGTFSSIANGGSEEQRKLFVAGWRVWADLALRYPDDVKFPEF